MYHHHDHHLLPSFPTTTFPPIPRDVSSFLPLSPVLQRTGSALSFDAAGHSYSYPMLEHRSTELLAAPPPIRRVFSTGDMDPSRCEGDTAGGGTAAAGARVGRYNAEERRERIERYRSKRSHRNFQKKITYACRKTLANSRPRVRGRFARNGEMEVEAEAEMEVGVNGCYDWSGFAAQTISSGREEGYCYEGDLWSDFLDVFAMDNLISD